jgi:hypothetical protein
LPAGQFPIDPPEKNDVGVCLGKEITVSRHCFEAGGTIEKYRARCIAPFDWSAKHNVSGLIQLRRD